MIEASQDLVTGPALEALDREGTPMLRVVHDTETTFEITTGESLLDAIARDGAQQMLSAALQAEIDAYIEAHHGELDENSHRLVVRNGYHEPRVVATVARGGGRAPAAGQGQTHRHRRTPSTVLLLDPSGLGQESLQVAEVLPLLYLHGLSSCDVAPALKQLLGSGAGLSPATITPVDKA